MAWLVTVYEYTDGVVMRTFLAKFVSFRLLSRTDSVTWYQLTHRQGDWDTTYRLSNPMLLLFANIFHSSLMHVRRSSPHWRWLPTIIEINVHRLSLSQSEVQRVAAKLLLQPTGMQTPPFGKSTNLSQNNGYSQ